MNTRKTLLSAAIVSCIAFSAHAQQAAPTATDLDTVTVTGIRGSMEKSLDTKREANARVEVVTAEDVGKLPAHNVADTLQRLPGVNISSSSADEGGFDEADRVSLRGTSPSLTQTLINGHTVGSADWFVLSQGNNVGRSVSYSLLPSELVSSVEVNKSSQAKLQDGGTTGTVNIITRKPLEFSKPFTAEGSIGAVRSDLAKSTDPQYSALFNYKNDEAAGDRGRLRTARETRLDTDPVHRRQPPPVPRGGTAGRHRRPIPHTANSTLNELHADEPGPLGEVPRAHSQHVSGRGRACTGQQHSQSPSPNLQRRMRTHDQTNPSRTTSPRTLH